MSLRNAGTEDGGMQCSNLAPELKTKWVRALRGGQFKQTKGTLYNSHTNARCCLGVLLKVADHEGADRQGGTLDAAYVGGPHVFGISDEHHEHLYNMNDNGQSFAEIADWIEANL
jgi:hypothetical protein